MKRTRAPHAKDGWYEISPSEAMALLNSQEMNRPLREYYAQDIATDIRSGEFSPNGETIVFDEKGIPLDGQHRLRACVIANKPITSYCVFGVPRKFFDKFDQGKVRGAADILAIVGTKHYALAAAVIKMAIAYETGSPTSQRSIPNWQVLDYAKKSGKPLASAIGEICHLVQNGKRTCVPPTVATFVYYLAREQDAKRAFDFTEKLITGAEVPKGGPIHALRNRLLDERYDFQKKRRHGLNTFDKLALTIKAWNLYREQKPCKVIRWAKGPGATGEAFPRIAATA